MLETLSLRNFQVHERLTVQFDPHVTSLTGKNDAGKSSVIRAIRWLAFNRPAGDSFKRRGSKLVKATLTLGDGRTVSRSKGEDNAYAIDDRKLLAFQSSVPDEVADLLNLSPVNLQNQHDAPFWFSLTPGAVAKELNRIVNLEAIDQALARIASRVRETRSVVSVTEGRLTEAETRLKQLAGVPLLVLDWTAVQELAERATETRDSGARLGDLVQEWKRVRKGKLDARTAAKQGQAVLSQAAGLLEMVEQINCLRCLVSEYESQKRKREESRTEVEKLLADLKKRLGGRCPLCGSTTNRLYNGKEKR